jgi:hypothetical protein
MGSDSLLQWTFTLVPRTVAPIWVSCGDDELHHDNIDPDEAVEKDIEWFTVTGVPVALVVSRSSRASVLPFYPLCFASPTRPAGTRFNYNLDTLFMDLWMNPLLVFFLDNLSATELSSIKYLAVADDLPNQFRKHLQMGFHEQNKECFTVLRKGMEKFSSLKEVCIAVDTLNSINTASLDKAAKEEIKRDEEELVDRGRDRAVELFSTFPEALVRRYNLRPGQIPQKNPSLEYIRDGLHELAMWNVDLAWYSIEKSSRFSN